MIERYEKNRLTVTRQLPYEADSTKTLDLCLFVNGIPVATAELKNPLTGQTRRARPGAVPHGPGSEEPVAAAGGRALRRRHRGGVDDDPAVGQPDPVPAVQPGHEMGPGNPPNPDGHRTAYLWEQVWQRDAWLDLLQRFVHVEPTPKGSKARPVVIFPRYPPVGRRAGA